MKTMVPKHFKYSIFIITAIFPIIANGQHIIAGITGSNEIYTDIADTTFIHQDTYQEYEQNYFLDIDNDGVNDFKIQLHEEFWASSPAAQHYNKRASIFPLHAASSLVTTDTTVCCIGCPNNLRKDVPILFNLGDTIHNSNNYTGSYASIWTDFWCDTYNSIIGDQYLGVKLQYSDTTILSWIHVDIQFQSLTLFDYSYATTSTIGLEENYLTNLSLYPNPTTKHFTIDLGDVKQDVKAILTNNLGQVILTEKYTSTNIINLDIDTPKGIYYLQLKTSNGEFITKKIIKE
jgi:hypothetical protein